MKWHAIFVETGKEDRVKEWLQIELKESNIRILVPKRKLRERKEGIWNEKVRILFPGYVLLNGDVSTSEYYKIRSTPGLIRVLQDGSGLLEIHESEIQIINKLVQDGDVIGTSGILLEGEKIIVMDGPLKGLDGLIEHLDRRKGRAKVRFNFIGEPRLVDLSIYTVQPA